MPSLNLDAALDRVDGDREFFGEMVRNFLKDSPQLMNRIRDGIAVGDLYPAGSAAHALKNWASGFGAPEVYQAAELIEQQLDSGSDRRAPSIRAILWRDASMSSTVELHRFSWAEPV